MRKLAFIVLLCGFVASHAQANELIAQHLPHAKEVGKGRLTYAIWDVYDATFYAQNGEWSADKPHALSLRYFRAIDAADIADRSVEEMRMQGFTDEKTLAAWHQQMLKIFPNVTDGTQLTAIFTDKKTTDFYHNGRYIGRVNDPLFGSHFFGIWLSERTSEPQLRKRLLGLL